MLRGAGLGAVQVRTTSTPVEGMPGLQPGHPARFAGTRHARRRRSRASCQHQHARSRSRDHGRVSRARSASTRSIGRAQRRPPVPSGAASPRVAGSSRSGRRVIASTSSAARPDVEGGVDVRHAAGAGRPVRFASPAARGHEDHRRDVAGAPPSSAGRGPVAGVAVHAIVIAAADARRRVVGVALELGREVGGHVEVDVDDVPARRPRSRREHLRRNDSRRRWPRRRTRARGCAGCRCGQTRLEAGAACAPEPVERVRAWRGRRGASRRAGTSPAPSPATVDPQPVVARHRPRTRPTARGRARRVSKPGPRFAVLAGTGRGPLVRSERIRPAHPSRPSAAAADTASTGRPAPGTSSDAVGVAQRPLRVLEAVPGDRETIARARRARSPASCGCEQPGDATRRRRLDEDADLGREQAVRGEDLLVGDRADEPPDSSRASTACSHEAGFPIRIARGDGLGLVDRVPRARSARRPRPGSPTSGACAWRGPAGEPVLAVAPPVRGDVAGVADGQEVDVGRVAERVDDLERRRLLALDPVGVDRVDEVHRVVPRRARGRSSRQSSKLPCTCSSWRRARSPG